MKTLSAVLAVATAVLPSALWTAAGAAVSVSEGTPVQVRLLQDIKSGHAKKGEQVRLEVVSDVLGPDRTVAIPKGTPVVGTVTRSKGRKMFGKPGKLEFAIEYIRFPDDTRIPLRSTQTAARGRDNSGAAIASMVLLAPIAMLVKGREVTVKTGREFGVFVDRSVAVATSNEGNRPALETVALHVPKQAPAQLSEIKLKGGLVLTGTVIGFKDGAYHIVTDGGAQMIVPQERVESITQVPAVSQTATAQE
jgi:hypothetical protein